MKVIGIAKMQSEEDMKSEEDIPPHCLATCRQQMAESLRQS